MHDILLPKGMCSESRDIFKFWETSDNISLTVQDLYLAPLTRYYHIVAMED